MGSFKRYVTPDGGEGNKISYKPLRKLGGGKGISVMSLRNAEKVFYMAISRETYLCEAILCTI